MEKTGGHRSKWVLVTCDGKNIKKWRCSLDLFLVLPAKSTKFLSGVFFLARPVKKTELWDS